MHAVEGAAVADSQDLLAGRGHPSATITLNLGDQPAWDLDVGDLGRQVAGHAHAGQYHHPGIHRDIQVDAVTPPQQSLQRVADLDEHEIGPALPRRNRTQPRGDADLEWGAALEHRIASSVTRLLDHSPHRQLAGAVARSGLVTI